MRKLILSTLFLLTSFAFAGQEIGMAPETVYQMKITEEEPVLFIDVRDPVEIMFIGGTDMVDLNIPYMLVDRDSWNEERGTFELHLNPNFTTEVAQALADRNLPQDTLIVTMCRSGSERGKPSADALRKVGFTNAHYVVNGFQGDAIKTGDNKGFRTQNGWQNSALPWTPKVDGNKIYRGVVNKRDTDNDTSSKNKDNVQSKSVDLQKTKEEHKVATKATDSKESKVIMAPDQSSEIDSTKNDMKSSSLSTSNSKKATTEAESPTNLEIESKKLPSIPTKEKEADDIITSEKSA